MAKTKNSRSRSSRKQQVSTPCDNLTLTTPPPGYSACAGAIAIVMADFIMDHFRRLYERFDGDLLLPYLLGEIAHHNVSPLFTAKGTQKTEYDKVSSHAVENYREKLLPCNAFSLSASTGIPRETIRRKVAVLVKRGWVRQEKNGQIFLTVKPAEDFSPEFNVITLNRFLSAARRIQELLDESRLTTG